MTIEKRESRSPDNNRTRVPSTKVVPYADMGMFAEEIGLALIMDGVFPDRRLFTTRHVGLAVGWAGRQGLVRELTEEESADMERDHDNPNLSLEKQVFNWLLTKAILMDRNAQEPQGRIEWKNMIANLDKAGVLGNIVSATKPLISRNAPRYGFSKDM